MQKTVMIMGEVLGDVFPEATLIGGAPYNVARHCHAFGLDVHLLTAVGQDALGARILAEMQAMGLSLAGVQTAIEAPTGQVQVHLLPDGHRFEILDQQAYDHIMLAPMIIQAQQHPPHVVYFGSLALRHAAMRTRFSEWLQYCSNATRVCDINLRAPWFDAESLRLCLHSADILKINHEELPTVSQLLGLPASPDLNALARQLLMVFGLSEMFVTCGEEGSFWLDKFGHGLRVPPARLSAPFVDSVGAGDAYTAVLIRGVLAGWSRQTILSRAASFAAEVCTVRGAVPAEAAFYEAFV